jgi:hypothetical protein
MKLPRGRGAADERRRREQRRLEQDIRLILKTRRENGLSAQYLIATLRGEDRVASGRVNGAVSWHSLWTSLLYNRAFGAFPGIRDEDVRMALNRLASHGEVICLDGRRWVYSRIAVTPP